MFGWMRSADGQAGATAAPVHDVAQVQVLGLLVTDTFRWKRDWATWRIRSTSKPPRASPTLNKQAAPTAPPCRRTAVRRALQGQENDNGIEGAGTRGSLSGQPCSSHA